MAGHYTVEDVLAYIDVPSIDGDEDDFSEDDFEGYIDGDREGEGDDDGSESGGSDDRMENEQEESEEDGSERWSPVQHCSIQQETGMYTRYLVFHTARLFYPAA